MSDELPICVGRETIQRLAAEGSVTFGDGRTLIAASDLFQRDPFARVEKLEHRLEIDRIYVLKPNATAAELDGPIDGALIEQAVPPDERDRQYDGITCRDETIKLQDERIDELLAEIAALKSTESSP